MLKIYSAPFNVEEPEDLLVNFIGAATFSVLGFFYIKDRDDYRIVERFLLRKKVKKKSD